MVVFSRCWATKGGCGLARSLFSLIVICDFFVPLCACQGFFVHHIYHILTKDVEEKGSMFFFPVSFFFSSFQIGIIHLAINVNLRSGARLGGYQFDSSLLLITCTKNIHKKNRNYLVLAH